MVKTASVVLALAAAVAAEPPAWDPWEAPRPGGRPETAGSAAAAPRLGLVAIRAYQVLVAPALGANCQFHPSCSRYAAACVAAHGLVNGTWLGAERLSRCHGFASLGSYPLLSDGRLLDPPGRPPLPVLTRLGL